MKRAYRIGEAATSHRTFTYDDVATYRALTGDLADPDDGVPEALIGGLFSDLLGTQLPGRGTNWMKQRLRFAAPAPIGEPLCARVEVVRVRPGKDLVNLRTVCCDAAGKVVCDGEALVMAREMA